LLDAKKNKKFVTFFHVSRLWFKTRTNVRSKENGLTGTQIEFGIRRPSVSGHLKQFSEKEEK